MNIKTAEDLACALDSPLEPELKTILIEHAERLAAYDGFSFDELAQIIVVFVSDRLGDDCPVQVRGGHLSPGPEYVVRHTTWFEIVAILTDDGFGVVVLVQQGEDADPDLIAACEAELPSPART